MDDSEKVPGTETPEIVITDAEPEEVPGTYDAAGESAVEAVEEIGETAAPPETETPAEEPIRYEFRNRNLLDKHYDKHGIEMGFASAEEYEAAKEIVKKMKEEA